MAGCHFCEIGAGRIVPDIVYEDEAIIAFLDGGPIRRGHCQVMPKAHHPYFEDIPPDLAAHLLGVAQRVAKAQKRLFGVERVAFLFTGGDIPHAHAHLVPMVEKTDITSRRYITTEDLTFQSISTPPEEEMRVTAGELRDALVLVG